MYQISVGADPECWLTKNGVIVPSVGLIPGTKEKPFIVEKNRVGLTLQEDNVSVELGWSPVKVDNFAHTAQKAFADARGWVRDTLGMEYDLLAGIADHQFKPEDLLSEQAQAFGCLPDQDAYLEGDFRLPIDPKSAELGIGDHRYTGGHIHVGYDKAAAQVPPWALVKMMDFAYLLWLQDGRDKQGDRRKIYGQPGIYREKPYGVEYRTPGSFWLNNPSLVYNLTSFAQHCLNKPRAAQKAYKMIPWDRVTKSIKEEDMHLTYGEITEIYQSLTYGKAETTNFKKAA